MFYFRRYNNYNTQLIMILLMLQCQWLCIDINHSLTNKHFEKDVRINFSTFQTKQSNLKEYSKMEVHQRRYEIGTYNGKILINNLNRDDNPHFSH